MDIVRLVALFTVISVHFFLNTGFYDAIVDGVRMLVMTCLRDFFMICVPLFVVLSGYLMKNKVLSKAYYKGLIKTLGIYVLASLACILYRFIVSPEPLSPMGQLIGIFDYTAAPYAWYVEMYIGLFLIIPFLNLMYNGLEGKKQKLILIGTFLLLTAIPAVVNTASSLVATSILPQWWIGIYPITYYFIGCYLREYPIKIKLSLNLLLIAVFTVGLGLLNYFQAYGKGFPWTEYTEHKSIFVVVLTVLVFSLFANMKYEKMGDKLRGGLGYLSNLVLGAYLCSWIFDNLFYDMLNAKVDNAYLRLECFIVVVPVIYICSMAASAVLNLIYNGIAKICSKAYLSLKNIKTPH